MNVRYLASFALALAVSGCSFYDVATNTVDAVFGTGLFSDKDPNYSEWDGLWDPETSQCIRDEKKLRRILPHLDARDERKYVAILPTGEKYAIDERSIGDESPPGPTAKCLAQTSY